MFTSPSTQVAAYAALQDACRRAAEQELRDGGARAVSPRRGMAGRLTGALAGVAVALTLLEAVTVSFAPADEAPQRVAVAPAAAIVR